MKHKLNINLSDNKVNSEDICPHNDATFYRLQKYWIGNFFLRKFTFFFTISELNNSLFGVSKS